MPTSYTTTRSLFDDYPTNYPGYTPLPSDGEPFVASSVNVFEKDIFNKNEYILEGAIKPAFSSLSVKAHSTDGFNIVVKPFICELFDGTDYIIVKSDKDEIINVSNLTPAATEFDIAKVYYVYVTQVSGVKKFVITLDAPHQYLIYKDNAGAQDKMYKFLFSFSTGYAAIVTDPILINPFFKTGNKTILCPQYWVSYFSPIDTVLPMTYNLFTGVILLFPPYIRRFIYKVDLYNGEIATRNNFNVLNTSGTSVEKRLAIGPDPRVAPPGPYNFSHFFTANGNDTVAWDSAGVNTSKAFLYLAGYLE